MGVNTKAIKRRIKSVGNTKKITKAMELVSAAKMRRAVEAAVNTRTYAKLAWDLLVHLSRTEEVDLPLLSVRPVKNILLVLFTSNRGLCGSFNSNIIRKTAEQLRNPENMAKLRFAGAEIIPPGEVKVDVIGVGKKGADFAKKMGYNLIASFTDFSDTPDLTDLMPISQMAINEYASKKYDKVVVAYTDYTSPVLQIARLRQVLPISETELEKMMAGIKSEETIQEPKVELADYLMEPGPQEVLKIVLPRLVETQIYQSALESAASEHSSRMMAMRNASDSAEDMISELSLAFNKARQASITQEIAEIAGGAAALG